MLAVRSAAAVAGSCTTVAEAHMSGTAVSAADELIDTCNGVCVFTTSQYPCCSVISQVIDLAYNFLEDAIPSCLINNLTELYLPGESISVPTALDLAISLLGSPVAGLSQLCSRQA